MDPIFPTLDTEFLPKRKSHRVPPPTEKNRTSDIFLSKFLKAYILRDDPAFDGGFRDTLNRAEKLGLISSSEIWFEIRELRNATVHEYSDSDLKMIFEKFRRYSPLLLELKTKLANASER